MNQAMASRRLSKAFEHAPALPLKASSRYVLFSDCHRGIGDPNDNFLKNEYLYRAALNYYYHRGFIYIELGDGDELWEHRSFSRIKEAHAESFQSLSRFYAAGRLYMIYGNHDQIKRLPRFARDLYQEYFDLTMEKHPLCPGIRFYPGIILKDEQGRRDIYLTHGHQVDLLNSSFWRLSRFLVRYLWKPLEKLGIPDQTSAAKNNTKKKRSEQRLTRWALDTGSLLVTGHTHHPMIGTRESPYCNTGSCIHPSGLTAIEIEKRCLTLVKWSTQARGDLILQASRETLGHTVCIDEYV